MRAIQSFLSDLGFALLPLTENIGHRASIYLEEYGLSVSLGMADALVAAAAVEGNQPLMTGNDKHYQAIQELALQSFRA